VPLRTHARLRRGYEATQHRRPFICFFAGKEELSLDLPGTALLAAVGLGDGPFLVGGAMAGG